MQADDEEMSLTLLNSNYTVYLHKQKNIIELVTSNTVRARPLKLFPFKIFCVNKCSTFKKRNAETPSLVYA